VHVELLLQGTAPGDRIRIPSAFRRWVKKALEYLIWTLGAFGVGDGWGCRKNAFANAI
jgi:hypothetical protein